MYILITIYMQDAPRPVRRRILGRTFPGTGGRYSNPYKLTVRERR